MNRAHPRYAVAVDVVLVGSAGECRGRTANMSAGGLCAELDESLAMGSEVVAQMALVFPDNETSESITLPGRVVWSTPINQHHQIGIQFTTLEEKARKDLALFLRFLAARPD